MELWSLACRRAPFVLVSAGVWLALAPPPARGDEWHLSLYGGQLSGSRNGDVIRLELQDSYFAGLGILKEFEQSPPHVRWEVEGVGLKHFGGQHHVEFAASINVRWITFPWDAYIDTSVAFGSGLSYATEAPEVEARDNPDTGSARFLHYIMLEVVLAVPGAPRWGVVARVHHRSGVFGLFEGVGRASNAFAGGLRYRF
ncbi:MAG: hypothetical protein ACREJ9_13170 [Candidatus Rokuibacteriota bacterium]